MSLGCASRLIPRMPLAEQELLTLLEHLIHLRFLAALLLLIF